MMNKKNLIVFFVSMMLFLLVFGVGSHFFPYLACKGCPPQSWSQVWNHKWIIFLISVLFGIENVFIGKK